MDDEQIIAFIRGVLPRGGWYYSAWLGEGRTGPSWRHKPIAADGEGALALVHDGMARSKHHRVDQYFAVAAYTNAKKHSELYPSGVADRSQENVRALRSLVVDLDFKNYASPEETLRAYVTAASALGLPEPSAIVGTGGGFHIYFTMPVELTKVQHLRLATALRNALLANRLVFDQGVTVDAARVVRLPGTLNYKYDPPRPVELLVPFSAPVDMLKFWAAVEPHATSLEPAGAALAVPASTAALLHGAADNSALGVYEDRPSLFGKIVEGCPLMKKQLETGGAGATRNLWFSTLQLLAFAADGADWVHPISQGHATYSPAETDREFASRCDARDAGKSGPSLCATLSASDPAIAMPVCAMCPHWQKIKTPLVLGYSASENYQEPTWVHNGATFMRVTTNTGEGGAPEVETRCIAPFACHSWVLSRGEHGELCLSFRATAGDATAAIVIPTANAMEHDKMQQALGAKGFPITAGQARTFTGAAMAWIETLRSRIRKTPGGETADNLPTAPHNGWDIAPDGKTPLGFAYSCEVFRPDGTSEWAGHNSFVRDVVVPKGELELWKAAAQTLLGDSRTVMHVPLAASFASPLMRLQQLVPNFVLSLVSNGSGHGKSQALAVATAVWGEPRAMLRQVDDTFNAILKFAALTRDLPIGYDDISGDHALKGLADMVFKLLQGRDKDRMRGTGDLARGGMINTIMTIAAQDSVLSAMESRRRVYDRASVSRLLEFEVPPIPPAEYDPSKTDVYAAVHYNHGHAGRQYAAWLAKNVDEAKEILQVVRTQVLAVEGVTSSERFWVAAITALVSGAICAGRAGVVEFDVPRLFSFLTSHLLHSRQVANQEEAESGYTLLASILQHHHKRVLWCDRMRASAQRGKPRSRRALNSLTSGETALIEIGAEERRVFIPLVAIQGYAQRVGARADVFRQALMSGFAATDDRRTPGAGTPYADPTPYPLRGVLIDFSSDPNAMDLFAQIAPSPGSGDD